MLLAPSVPLIMVAIIARVPINTMFLAGTVPAGLMVLSLLAFGGYLGKRCRRLAWPLHRLPPQLAGCAGCGLAGVKWELLAPVVAIGSLVSGLATPTESAALTAGYAIATQAWAHRSSAVGGLRACLGESAQIIGGVLVILGMALGLTNYLIDAGIPDAAIEAVQGVIPDRNLFLLALVLFCCWPGR